VRHVYERVADLFEHLVADDPRALAGQYRAALEALEAGDREAAKAAFSAVFARRDHGRGT